MIPDPRCSIARELELGRSVVSRDLTREALSSGRIGPAATNPPAVDSRLREPVHRAISRPNASRGANSICARMSRSIWMPGATSVKSN